MSSRAAFLLFCYLPNYISEDNILLIQVKEKKREIEIGMIDLFVKQRKVSMMWSMLEFLFIYGLRHGFALQAGKKNKKQTFVNSIEFTMINFFYIAWFFEKMLTNVNRLQLCKFSIIYTEVKIITDNFSFYRKVKEKI